MSLTGRIVAAFGRQYLVRSEDGMEHACVPRGKKSEAACGDHVTIQITGTHQGAINAIAPRRNLLYRSDAFKQKIIAANVDQVVFICATEPAFSESLLTRCLVAAESQGMDVLLVLNKCDLPDGLERARSLLAPYAALAYPVLELSARQDVSALKHRLEGRTSVLVGQSGMGKSTLVNALVPGAAAATREISTVLDSGKHTTTHVRLYEIDAHTALLDSPGMQEFGLYHLGRHALEEGFREFRPLLDACRFRDCRHDAEPGCVIREAVQAGTIHPVRYTQFLQLCRELER